MNNNFTMKRTLQTARVLAFIALAAILPAACSTPDDPPPTYTVTFDTNGGGEDNITLRVQSGSTIPGHLIPEDLVHDDSAFAFSGWNTRKSGVGNVFDENFPITRSIIVYAQWKEMLYTVTFDPTSGALYFPDEKTIEVRKGEALYGMFPFKPVWTGHVFTEWNTTRSGTGSLFTKSTPVNGNLTVYAIWDSTGTYQPPLGGGFVAVSGISGVPTSATVGTPLTLSGTINPSTATYQTITWSTTTTGATISGSSLSTTQAGTVSVTATIVNGLAEGTNYTQTFTITASAGGPPAYNPAVDYTVDLTGKTVKNSTPISSTYDETCPKVVLNLPTEFVITGYTKISIKAKFYDSSNALIDIGTPDSGTGYGKGQAKILSDATKASYESPNPIATIPNLGKQNGDNPSQGSVQFPISWTTKPEAILAQSANNDVKYIEITEITFHK